jgi:hypothetical protein
VALRDRIVQFFAREPSKPLRGSLSAGRATDQWAVGYGGLVGKRIVNSDPLLTIHGGGDIALWADIHDDERAFSCFQQRRLAVVSRPWEIEPGAQDRKSKKAAEFLRDQLNHIGWDRICYKMLFGVWYGYGVAEAIYRIEPEGPWAGLVGLDRVDIPDRAWFGFGKDGELRLIDAMGIRDEPVPDRKFWSFSSGSEHDFAPYGIGLAHWLFWPVFFKRQGLPFWLQFLERFGAPTVVGKVAEGRLSEEAERNKILALLRSISGFGVAALPSGMEVELLQAAASGAGGYELLMDRMDAAITRVILSQTMTTDNGSSRSQAEVHKDVRDEVVRSDADLLHESFNRTIAVWLTEINFPGATPPRVYRQMEDPEDLDTLATRDEALKRLGWIRTEDSFREIYGEGYEKAPEPEPKPIPMLPGADPAAQPEFAATDLDAIDRLVTAMGEAGNEAVLQFIAPLKEKLAGISNPELLRIALLNHLETMDPGQFAEVLADPMLALRAASEVGIEGRVEA